MPFVVRAKIPHVLNTLRVMFPKITGTLFPKRSSHAWFDHRLKKLLETRSRLNDLMAKVDRSDELEGLLENVLQDPDALKKLQSELGMDSGSADAPTEGGE